MAKLQACLAKIHVGPGYKIYLYFCIGFCSSKVSVGKYKQAVQ